MKNPRPERPPRRPLRSLSDREVRDAGGCLSTVEREWQFLASLEFFYRRGI